MNNMARKYGRVKNKKSRKKVPNSGIFVARLGLELMSKLINFLYKKVFKYYELQFQFSNVNCGLTIFQLLSQTPNSLKKNDNSEREKKKIHLSCTCGLCH